MVACHSSPYLKKKQINGSCIWSGKIWGKRVQGGGWGWEMGSGVGNEVGGWEKQRSGRREIPDSSLESEGKMSTVFKSILLSSGCYCYKYMILKKKSKCSDVSHSKAGKNVSVKYTLVTLSIRCISFLIYVATIQCNYSGQESEKQFTVYISNTSVTLKQGQGHQTYNYVDPKQGYNHAQFERSPFKIRKYVKYLLWTCVKVKKKKKKRWYFYDLVKVEWTDKAQWVVLSCKVWHLSHL